MSGTTGPSTDPEISFLTNGDVHVVWADRLDGKNQIYHARSSNGGSTWYSVQPISGAQGYAPTLALAPDEQVWVAWQGEANPGSGEPVDIYVAKWDGESWSSPEDISSDLAGDSRSPHLGCDATGLAHLTWEQESPEGVLSVQYVSGLLGDWSLPFSPSSPSDQATQPHLAIGPGDAIYIAWDGGSSLVMRCRQGGSVWEGAEQIAANEAGIGDVAITVDAHNTVYAVWSARDESGVRVLFSSQRALAETPTPSPTGTSTMAPTVPLTVTVTATATRGETVPPPPTSTYTPTRTVSPTVTPTFTATRTATPTMTRWPSPTSTPVVPTNTPTETPRPTETGAPKPHVFIPAIWRNRLVSLAETPGQHQPPPLPNVVVPEAQPTTPNWAWSPVDNVSSSSHDSHAATIALGADDTIYAVWTEQFASDYSMLCYSICSAGVWSTSDCFYVGEEPDLILAPDGEVHLVYSNEFDGKYDVFYTKWSGGSWSPPENISYTSGTSSQPAIAAKGDGSLVVVWTDTTEGYNRIYHAWQADGVWNTYFVPASIDGSAPDVAVGKNDRVWITWQVEVFSKYDVFALFGNGVSWAPYAVNVSDSSGADSIAARLLGVSDFGAFIVWQEDGDDRSEVYCVDNLEYVDWWDEPSNVSHTSTRSEQPSVAVNSLNQIHVAWDEGDRLLLQRRVLPSGSWLPTNAIIAGIGASNGTGGSAASAGEVELVADNRSIKVHAIWSALENENGQQEAVTLSDSVARDIYYSNGSLSMPHKLWLSLALSENP